MGGRDDPVDELALVVLVEHEHEAQVEENGVEFDGEGRDRVADEKARVERNGECDENLKGRPN